MITTILWPFALLTVAENHNLWHMDNNGKTPMMKLLGTSTFPDIKQEHTFGCPVYVLDHRLQSSSIGPPKWEPRSRLGIYIGRSPFHAGSVALVLNPRTGLVSPQYHLVFDDDFSTVPFISSNDIPPQWSTLVNNSSERTPTADYKLVDTWFEPDSSPPSSDTPIVDIQSSATPLLVPEGDLPRPNLVPDSEGGQTTPTTSFEIESSQDQNTSEENNFINLETAGLRRSPRNHQPGSLPPNCFMVKSQCFASSFSNNVIAGMKK